MVQYLLEQGADKVKDSDIGTSPLLFATMGGFVAAT